MRMRVGSSSSISVSLRGERSFTSVPITCTPKIVPSASLTPSEEKVIRKLRKSGPATVTQLKADAPLVKRLGELGLVSELLPDTKRGKVKLALTEAGLAAAARLPKERVTQVDLYREILALREQVEELKEILLPRPRLAKAPTPEPLADTSPLDQPATPADFAAALRAALGEIDRRGRHGGLVPLPEVRKALSGLGLSREAFDEALLEQERAFAVDLKTAHDPQSLVDREQGISDTGRGILYYVVLR
jgi:hypothetical protein